MRQSRASTMRLTIASAMAKAEIAAGDGALQKCSERRVCFIRKSSIKFPAIEIGPDIIMAECEALSASQAC